MNLQLSKTPTLEAVAHSDDTQLAADLQAKIVAAVELVDQDADVRSATETSAAAHERLARLRKAERWLSGYAKEVEQRVASQREAALDGLIESAAAGEKPEFKALREVGVWEAQARSVSRAIERLVEKQIPAAELQSLREEAHSMVTKSRALERMAQERAEKLLEQMREAVQEEMVLPVDISKGVSGALLAHAAEFRERAIQISENADRIEKMYGLSR